jgi:hypothetical protein
VGRIKNPKYLMNSRHHAAIPVIGQRLADAREFWPGVYIRYKDLDARSDFGRSLLAIPNPHRKALGHCKVCDHGCERIVVLGKRGYCQACNNRRCRVERAKRPKACRNPACRKVAPLNCGLCQPCYYALRVKPALDDLGGAPRRADNRKRRERHQAQVAAGKQKVYRHKDTQEHRVRERERMRQVRSGWTEEDREYHRQQMRDYAAAGGEAYKARRRCELPPPQAGTVRGLLQEMERRRRRGIRHWRKWNERAARDETSPTINRSNVVATACRNASTA